jgi:hypothetical protein
MRRGMLAKLWLRIQTPYRAAAVSEVGAMESQGGVAGIGTERRAMRGERGSYFRDGSTQSF